MRGKRLLSTIRRAAPSAMRLREHLRLASSASRSRNWSDAAAAYRVVLDLAPERGDLWVQYGHALKEQGYLHQAEAAYRRAAGLNPTVGDVHLQLGHVLKLGGRNDEAVAAYEAAHRLEPAMEHGRAELAALRSAGQTRSAGLHRAASDPAVGELLARHQLGPAFLEVFDAFYYHQANPAVRATVGAPGFLACLEHFCRAGLEQGLAIHADYGFDAGFYKESALGGMRFTPANAYRHWLTVGIPQGAAPNRRRWIHDRLGSGIHDLDSIDLAGFAAQADPRAAQAGWTQLAERFIAEAGGPGRPVEATAENAGVLAALAARLEGGNPSEAARAFHLRQSIAAALPGHTGNRAAYAHALMRRGDILEALRSYRSIVSDGSASPSVYRGLAECQDRLGQPEAALGTLRAACQAHPGSEALREHRLDQGQRVHERAWMLAYAAARVGRVAEGREIVDRAAACVCASFGSGDEGVQETPAARSIRRVALVSHNPLPQCRAYRIDQAAALLAARGYVVECFDLGMGGAAFRAAMHGLDAVVFCRVPALPAIVDVMQAARRFGLVTFYEIDDLIFGPDYPPELGSYGGLVNGEEHIGLALAAPLFEHAMRLCRYGIASTPSLAESMRGRVESGQVFVRANVLGPEHMEFADRNAAHPRTPGRAVTIFHGSGTKAHKQDFETLLLPALVALARRHGSKIAIVLMGDFPDSEALRSIADHVTLLPPVWDREAYWSVLACADINLAVLQRSAVTDAKSGIKWLEAAMLGIPSAVSDTDTYRAIVRAGETGMLCGTQAEWETAIDRLVRDPALRMRIGQQARQQALAEFSFDAMADRLDAMLRGLSAPEDLRPLVVVVNVFYPPQAIGGATRVVHDNVRDLVARAGDRFRVEVFASLEGGAPYAMESIAADGVRVTRIGAPDDPALEQRSTDPRMGEAFGSFLDRTRPALVHFHCVQRLTASIVAATAERGIPYVVTVHDGWWISDHQFLLDQVGRVSTYDMDRPLDTLREQGVEAHARMTPLRAALQGARRVTAVSGPFAAVYRESGVHGVVTIANGLSARLAVERQAGPPGKVRLGFIGGLARHKGYDLIRIAMRARAFRNLTLLLIDHAMAPGEVRRDRWGSVEVEFRPKWPQGEVGTLYGAIDVLLAPSLWPESFGLVTREAALCGCWVVASDRGSIGANVEDGKNGFVIDVSSPDGLTGVLERIDADPERFRSPPAGVPTVRQAWEQADELAVLYEELLAPGARGSTGSPA